MVWIGGLGVKERGSIHPLQKPGVQIPKHEKWSPPVQRLTSLREEVDGKGYLVVVGGAGAEPGGAFPLRVTVDLVFFFCCCFF